MGDKTEIAWTDATVNFWWGCTKVAPACDNCYAETWDHRMGGSHWGVGAPRKKIASAVALLRRLNAGAAKFAADHSRRRRVFIQSMSDLFDLEAPVEWFVEAWAAIEACDQLDIQVVTKRVSVVHKRLPETGSTTWPRHAGLMISVGSQPDADRDVPRLLTLKADLGIPWIGVSAEPLLSDIDFTCVPWPVEWSRSIDDLSDGINALRWTARGTKCRAGIDWIIVGGESGPHARPMEMAWARGIVTQCAASGVACFVKQLGSATGFNLHHSKGGDPAEWASDLRVRQFPSAPR